jgi:hypothetical protein
MIMLVLQRKGRLAHPKAVEIPEVQRLTEKWKWDHLKRMKPDQFAKAC